MVCGVLQKSLHICLGRTEQILLQTPMWIGHLEAWGKGDFRHWQMHVDVHDCIGEKAVHLQPTPLCCAHQVL